MDHTEQWFIRVFICRAFCRWRWSCNHITSERPSDDATFSEGYLRNLVPLALQVPEFAKVVMILDGDVKKSSKIPKNLLFLPGDERPETVIYKWLKKLSDADSFWKEITGTGYGYTKQFAIGRYNSIKNKDKKFYKNWYKEQHPYWGRAINIVFEKWADRNKDLCKRFCNDFLKIFDQVSPRTLPIDLMNQIIEIYSSKPIIDDDTERSHLPEQRKTKKKKVPNENLQVNMFTQHENS